MVAGMEPLAEDETMQMRRTVTKRAFIVRVSFLVNTERVGRSVEWCLRWKLLLSQTEAGYIELGCVGEGMNPSGRVRCDVPAAFVSVRAHWWL